MRGTISLDFILSLVVLMIVSSVLFGLSFAKVEDAGAVSMKYKAEALAMAMGSAINHFYAVQPEHSSFLKLKPKTVTSQGLFVSADKLGSGGWDKITLDPTRCWVNISSDVLRVTVEYVRKESNFQENVSAVYPLVHLDNDLTALCNETLFFNETGGVYKP